MNVGLRKLAEQSSDVYDFIRRYQKALPTHHEGTGARELAELYYRVHIHGCVDKNTNTNTLG